jgi:hypothetical protein
MPFPQRKTQEINSFCLQETGNAREKKPTLRPKKSYLISPRPPVLHVDLSRHHRLQLPGPLHLLHVTAHPTITVPRCPAASAAWLSSPPPRRSALQPSAAASPRFLSSLQAVAPPCTWPSRAAAGSRPARSGASRSAEARSAAAGSRRPTWTRTRRRRGRRRSGKGSRWGSRCRRSPCRSCRTRRSPTSGRGLSGRPSASSCSTCGRSASSSA